MSNNKYIVATIKLPIEMLSDGTFKTNSDRADISFLQCASLPPINTNLNTSAFDKLQELIGQNRPSASPSAEEILDSPLFVFRKINTPTCKQESEEQECSEKPDTVYSDTE